MEATGVYWKPVYYLLEDDFELLLVNAQHIKHVPGRKTDVQDAQWLAELLEHGLLRPSFVPPKPIRELRDLTRYRKSLVWERQREANRLQKVLEDANIKLGGVASRRAGRLGQGDAARALRGRGGPEALAELAKGKLRRSCRRCRAALEGRFRPTTRCSSRTCSPTSSTSTRRSTRCPPRSRSACALSSASVSCSARSPASPSAPPR